MALSKQFLEELGITQGNVLFLMNKKQDLDRTKNTAWRAFAAYTGVNEPPARQRAAFGAKTCCGTRELHGLEEAEPKTIKKAVVLALQGAWRTVIYYTISQKARKILADIGFEEIDAFENDNTGNTVHVMWLNVME